MQSLFTPEVKAVLVMMLLIVTTLLFVIYKLRADRLESELRDAKSILTFIAGTDQTDDVRGITRETVLSFLDASPERLADISIKLHKG